MGCGSRAAHNSKRYVVAIHVQVQRRGQGRTHHTVHVVGENVQIPPVCPLTPALHLLPLAIRHDPSPSPTVYFRNSALRTLFGRAD